MNDTVLIGCGEAEGAEGPSEAKALLQAVSCPLPPVRGSCTQGAHLGPGSRMQGSPASGTWLSVRDLKPKLSPLDPGPSSRQTLVLDFLLECGAWAIDPGFALAVLWCGCLPGACSGPLPSLPVAVCPCGRSVCYAGGAPAVLCHDLTQRPEGLPTTFHCLGGLSAWAPADL